MKPRTTLYLLITVLLMTGFILLIERRLPGTVEQIARTDRAMPIDPALVTWVQLDRGDMHLVCERNGESWRMVDPVGGRVDEGRLERLLIELSEVRLRAEMKPGELEDLGLDLRDYGLDRPRAVISFNDGRGLVRLELGRDLTVGSGEYARIVGDKVIWALDSALSTLVPEQVDELRDHRLFVQTPFSIQRVELTGTGGFLQIARAGDGMWRVQQPEKCAADASRMNALIEELSAARIESFVTDNATDLAAYGLDEPSGRIALWGASSDRPETLLLGRLAGEDKNRLYAKKESENLIVEVSSQLSSLLSYTTLDMRDRHVVHLAPERISALHMEQNENMLDLQRQEDGSWRVVSPRDWPADLTRVRQFIGAWTTARALGYPKETMDAAPEARLSFEYGDEQPLVFGISTSSTQSCLLVTGDEGVMQVAPELWDTISVDPLYWRSRVLLALNQTNIESISIEGPGGIRQVRFDVQGQPEVVSPEGWELKPEVIKAQLVLLGGLQVQRSVEENAEDLKPYGLDQPERIFTISLREHQALAKVMYLGSNPETGKKYGMIRGEDLVFELDAATYTLLMQWPCQAPVPHNGSLNGGSDEKP